MEFFVSGSQQRLKDIALNGNPIGKRTEAVKKLTDQDALFEVAQKASFDFVRKEAIMKLEDPQRVLKLAADDRGFKDRGNAVARFLSIRKPETFFEEIFKVTDNRNRIADTAKLVHKDYLKMVLSGTGDAELVKMIVPVKYYFDNYRIKDIVGCDYDTYAGIVKDRILELEGDKEGAYISSLKTDGEKRAYVESLAKEKEDRLRALKTIADDKVLADILVKTGDKDIRKTAAQQIKDEAVLEQAAGRMTAFSLQDIYPVLAEKCRSYTPEYIANDKRAPMDFRIRTVDATRDREVLRRLAEGCEDMHLRWRAAYILQDKDIMNKVLACGEKRINGHVIIVTRHSEWQYHEEQCILCRNVYGVENDSESTRHYGKSFEDIPCRPDYPKR